MMEINEWIQHINKFLLLTQKHALEILMVGGGAVNLHGYQRHSADVDFWVNTNEENFDKLLKIVVEMGFDIKELPQEVINLEQNISIHFSPVAMIEIITKFDCGKTFEEAWEHRFQKTIQIDGKEIVVNVLNLEDLIASKVKAARYKDLLDVHKLKEIHNLK